MSESILQEYADKAFISRQITIKFRDKILAGVPASDDMLDYFMNARHMSDKEKADLKSRVQDGKLTDAEKDEIKNMAHCVFEKDSEGQLCVWAANLKAMIREIMVCTGLTQRRPNKKAGEESAGGRQLMQHTTHIDPLRCVFHRDGKPLMKPDGYVDRIKHISDAAGQRSAIGRHDYIDKAELTFILRWPTKGDKIFTEDDMKMVLAMCQENGLGASRSQSFGRFDVIKWVNA